MDRLFTTPKRKAIFSWTGIPLQEDCSAPLWENRRQVPFPKTQQCIAQFSVQAKSRQPYGCQHALFLSTLKQGEHVRTIELIF